MRRKALSMITLLITASISWQSNAAVGDNNTTATLGAAAPAFTLEDHNGNTVKLSDYAGKIVVLEWTNPDCPYVQRHYKAKTMITLAEKYKTKGVVWLAINSTHYMNRDANNQWASQQGVSYPILVDQTGQVGKLYAAKTTPHMFIIDKSGKLVYEGGIDDNPRGSNTTVVNYVEKALDELLAGKPVSVPQSKPYGCSMKYAN